MIPEIKRLVRHGLNHIGYDMVRLRPKQNPHVNFTNIGKDPFVDMKRFLPGRSRPIFFDVGANKGQSIRNFRNQFPECTVHSFEPSPATYEQLKNSVQTGDGVSIWNYGLGSVSGKMKLLENSSSDMTSFLPLGEAGWGKIVNETWVTVKTVDQFCRDNKIQRIDVLKSDTQGFDLEVLKGADKMISEERIGLLYFEITFAKLYENMPLLSDIFEFLESRDFHLVSFYRFFYRTQLASWTDALFVHKSNLHTDV